ncbi:MAG: hypothetical protein JEZ07_13315 [Phycisphaerae bacterium]|nr:hypothetical protein [Phycisphaerae bacterium]
MFKKMLLIISLVLFVCIGIYEYYLQELKSKRFSDGLKLIQDLDIQVYQGSGCLYALDKQKGTWKFVLDDVFASRPQSVVFGEGFLIAKDFKDYKTKLFYSNKSPDLLDEIDIYCPCALSNGQHQLAYFDFLNKNDKYESLNVIDIKSKAIESYSDIRNANSISWSLDDKSLYISRGEKISRFNIENGEQSFIANGYWCKVLPNNEIGFWRIDGKYSTCLKMNIDTKNEDVMFSTKHYVLAADWGPTGRYVIVLVSTAIHGFLFISDYVALPIIWDTETGNQYWLPPLRDIKGGSVYWIDGKEVRFYNR